MILHLAVFVNVTFIAVLMGSFIYLMRFFFFLFFLFSLSIKAESLSLEDTLKQAIYHQEAKQIQFLLDQYLQTEKQNPIVLAYAEAKLAFLQQDYSKSIRIYRNIISQNPELNSIRMELAIALLADYQDSAAAEQLNRVKSADNLPQSAYQRIDQYLNVLEQRNHWKIDGSLSYLKTNNVNNVAGSKGIENTGFIKNDKMMPQKANGVFYNLSFSKEINLYQSHYFSFSNETRGKMYWDNHQYDDISNRTFLGYVYKKADYTWRIKSFYDRRSYSNHSYHWSNGIQLGYRIELSPNWQNQIEVEYEKRRFFKESAQAGNIRTLSNNLLWYPKPTQLFYIGGTFSRENTQERQYNSDIKNVQLGWLQEYTYGISTKLHLGFTHRQFKDQAILAGILPLGKIRKDKIYFANFQIWKRDWHWEGITPKISLSWKKQKSNLNTLYSYKDNQATILLEKTF